MPNASSIMRHKVVLQERVLTPNSYGEEVPIWEDGPTLAASFEPLRGGEYWKGQNMPQLAAQVEARVRIRFRQGLRPEAHRLKYDGVFYDIKAVIHDRRRRETQLMVKAVALKQTDGGKVNV